MKERIWFTCLNHGYIEIRADDIDEEELKWIEDYLALVVRTMRKLAIKSATIKSAENPT